MSLTGEDEIRGGQTDLKRKKAGRSLGKEEVTRQASSCLPSGEIGRGEGNRNADCKSEEIKRLGGGEDSRPRQMKGFKAPGRKEGQRPGLGHDIGPGFGQAMGSKGHPSSSPEGER